MDTLVVKVDGTTQNYYILEQLAHNVQTFAHWSFILPFYNTCFTLAYFTDLTISPSPKEIVTRLMNVQLIQKSRRNSTCPVGSPPFKKITEHFNTYGIRRYGVKYIYKDILNNILSFVQFSRRIDGSTYWLLVQVQLKIKYRMS